jgi:hypothetical protein
MPGPWRLRPRADETQPLGIVRQIHVDQELERLRLQPRDVWTLATIDVHLDRRLDMRTCHRRCVRCVCEVLPGQDYDVLPGTGGPIQHTDCHGGEGGAS